MSKKKRYTEISGRDAELAFLALLDHCDEGAQLRQRMAMEQVKIQRFVHRRAGMSSDERQRAKELVVEIVEREDKTVPLTDDQISDMLFEQNLGVTSWTARKLRLELGIPSSVARNERIRKNEAMRVIAALVDAEDKKEPASDDALRAKLLETGVSVARRTVAKYRRAMGIPNSNRRRERPDLAHIRELVKCIVEKEDWCAPLTDMAIACKLHDMGIDAGAQTVGARRLELGIPGSFNRIPQDHISRVQGVLRRLIDSEDRRSPLSDAALSERMRAEGVNIPARLVTTCRWKLGVPAAGHRLVLAAPQCAGKRPSSSPSVEAPWSKPTIPVSAELKRMVDRILSQESTVDPLTDPQIAALVKSEGYRCTWTQVKRVLIEFGIPAPFYRKRG